MTKTFNPETAYMIFCEVCQASQPQDGYRTMVMPAHFFCVECDTRTTMVGV